MQRILILSLLFTCFVTTGFSQSELPLPVNIRNAYEKGTRDQNGLPGKNYWQNKAMYEIDVVLHPDSSKIVGSEQIQYRNNSPDTLQEIVLTILADIFRRGNSNDFGIPLSALNEGVQITRITVEGKEIDLSGDKFVRSGTNAAIRLDKALMPGADISLEIDWHFIYPKRLTIRCGDYGDSTFFVAYFYPKIAVYDDLDGWDRHNYTGYGEFFGAFADYTLNVTVPRDFKVWATGELQNPDAVFSADYAAKWREAIQSPVPYTLIGPDNYLDDNITQAHPWITWQFRAKNVPDVAFGTSDKFLWDVIQVEVDPSSGRKTTFHAAFRVDSKDYYRMAELGKQVLENYSSHIPGIPYPYPSMTVFNGNSGMEFPMMCNNASCETWDETAGLAYHEIAHTYFPFFVGTNERKYAWMDEGWANLLPFFYFDEHSPEVDYLLSRTGRYLDGAGKEIEVPVMTLGDILTQRMAYRQASYNKPFFAYLYLHELLGREKFTQTLRSYMEAWAKKHPMPYDFFYSFNHFSGMDLNWYWKNWFFERNYADLTLSGLDDNIVTVANPGGLFVPVELHIRYNDGSERFIRKEASIWENGQNPVQIKIDRTTGLEEIRLGSVHIPDVFPEDNVFPSLKEN